MGIINLLATRLGSITCRIPNAYDNFLIYTFFQHRCNIKREWIETTLVLADMLPVHIDVALPVYRANMQQGSSFTKCFRYRYRPAIPQGVLFPNFFPHSG